MGVKLMELGVYMRKGVIFTIKGCCRSVWKHPILVCVMCAFIYMSRSYPCMFSLLVSASPVLVCTAVLLGVLLLSGQQNIPETEKEKRARYEAIALKHGMLYDANNVNEQNERCCVERYSKSKRDEVEKVGVESGLLVSKLAEIRVGGSVDGGGALSKERRSVGNESESSETWEATGELDAPTQQQKGEWSEERVGDGESMADHYAIISKVIGELLESESEQEKSDEEDCSDSDSVSDSERGSVDSPPHDSWKKQVQRHKDGDGAGDDDDDSDGAESSSPDASIDEMMPMLDELHPLLDEDAAQPVQMSRVGSEAALTEQSPRSSISSSSSIESGEETEVPGSEAADDDDEESKKDQTKSVITWTEEDQKNLMDVGSSEIERNQRLERILRRRKNMSMVPEINLIDFENSDFQLNIAPISTSRRNPFDLPHDAYDSNAPGSAPSIMLQRRNPFDLPYDEDEDETADEELRLPSQSRQPFLRRRDNFLARPSIFAPKGEERQPARFRPFFIPDQTASEESSYSSFQGQSSGVNSGHETESVSSVEYLEEDHKVPHQGASGHVGSCPVYDTSPGKNYSSSSSFSDAHSELDPGLTPRAPVTDHDDQGQVTVIFYQKLCMQVPSRMICYE